MALDDISSNKRSFCRFTVQEFEQCLEETELDFERPDPEELSGTWEYVYDAKSKNGTFTIRVWSTVDIRTDKARDDGSDAIRVVMLHTESGEPVLSEKRTNRIQTWCKNLKNKISNLLEKRSEISICGSCGAVMVIRKNSETGNKFFGCTNYPECKNTKAIE